MSWRNINGGLHQITCKGANVVGCSADQSIYQRNYNDDTWTNLPGAAVWAAAGIDYSVWCCNAAQAIYRWNAATSNWDRMPGACVQIDAWTRDRAVCVNASQELYEFQNGSWRQLPGEGTHITIGANGEKWHVNSRGLIFRMLPGQGQWQHIPGGLKTIQCTDGNNVAGVHAGGDLFRWNGSSWTQLPGGGTHIGITWGNMWHVNSSNAIYQAFI